MSDKRTVATESSDPDYIRFGDVARNMIGMQCQYASDYLDSIKHPALAAGVRWRGNLGDYHFLTIHKDDVAAFVDRVQTWRKARGIIE